MIAPELLGLAEDANTHTPLRPGEERIERDRYVVWMSASYGHAAFTVAQRLRLDDAWETDVEEVRALLRARGRLPFTWEVGTHATPTDIGHRFLTVGMRPFEEPLAIGMVMTEPPPADRRATSRFGSSRRPSSSSPLTGSRASASAWSRRTTTSTKRPVTWNRNASWGPGRPTSRTWGASPWRRRRRPSPLTGW